MSERFVRIGIEIPLSLYSNLDKIKNGSAASNRILEAVKKEKDYIDNSKYAHLDSYDGSVYDEKYTKPDLKTVIRAYKGKTICGNCKYFRNIYDYPQCFAQKGAPKVDYNHTCGNFIYKENNHEDQETC